MDNSTHRFADYATSGAFQIGLTRSQIASLVQVAGGDHTAYVGMTAASALLRKGLVILTESAGRGDQAQIRATAAGILVANLCAMAGLTNSAIPDLAAEVDRQNEEIDGLRRRLFDIGEDNWSLRARLEATEIECNQLRANMAGGHFPRPMVTLRDRQPEKPVEAMDCARDIPARPATPHPDFCPHCAQPIGWPHMMDCPDA